MSDQLPQTLQDHIDWALTELRSANGLVGVGMRARNVESHIKDLLSWVVVTTSTEKAAQEALKEAAKFFRSIEQVGPLEASAQKARALPTAESSLGRLADALKDAEPSEKAKALGIAWK